MKIDISKFIIKECSEDNFISILELQEEAFKFLESPELLRKNTPEMLLSILKPPHVTLGAWYENELVAFSVLYFPNNDAEELTKHLENVKCSNLKSANYKLCIVKKEFRGNSLQYELGVRLIEYAVNAGVKLICATASPYNVHSINNIIRMGFVYNKTLKKYGYKRNLYYKLL